MQGRKFTSGNFAWVFPGQGSQEVGMGAGFRGPAALETFAEASDVLGWDVARLCREGPAAHLDATAFTQPALLTVSVAAARTLEGLGLRPDLVAGHSVGEFAAAVVAGAVSFDAAVHAVAVRGDAMQRAGREHSGRMAAIIGLPVERVEAICALVPGVVTPANLNGPQQVVVSGEDEALAALAELVRAERGRIIRLNVSVAAHSPLMGSAREELARCLTSVRWSALTVPFASGVTGRLHHRSDDLAELFVEGVTRPVRWLDAVHALAGAGAETYVEVGPGSVLSGLIARIVPEARTTQVGDDESATEFARELASV